ncbi:MAG: signal peptidase I [Polyangiaceae bacterium]
MSTPPPEEIVDDSGSNAGLDSPPSRSPLPIAAGKEAVVSDFPDQGPLLSNSVANRLLRLSFWSVWFFALPMLLACLFVWALTPAIGIERGDVIGFVESFVREQPVPVGIIAFTLFEILIWQMRDRLPFSRYAYPPLRDDVPASARGLFERARSVLEEAEGIQLRNEHLITRDLSARERGELQEALSNLRRAMEAKPFNDEALFEALTKAEVEIEGKLGRWRKSEIREYLESILVAVAVAMALRAFVIEAFKIPSGSMIPTLMVGDHIFVNKSVYGPAVPWSDARFWTRMPPKRGDVIVFAYPEQPSQDFIKRTIALPGDKLEARAGHPWINDWEVPHCVVGTLSYEDAEVPLQHHEGELDLEYLGEEAYLTFFDRSSVGYMEYQGPFIVKPNEVMVMGDNRNNSHDSRMWWGGQGGGVPYPNIRGRALFVWLSVSDQGFDWSRLGAPVMGHPRVPPAMRPTLQANLDKCWKDRPPTSKTYPPKPAVTINQPQK